MANLCLDIQNLCSCQHSVFLRHSFDYTVTRAGYPGRGVLKGLPFVRRAPTIGEKAIRPSRRT